MAQGSNQQPPECAYPLIARLALPCADVTSWLRKAKPRQSDDVKLKRSEVAMHLVLFERFFVGSDGEMWLRDQHLDGFSRGAFPVIYAIFVGVMAARVPSRVHSGVECPGF